MASGQLRVLYSFTLAHYVCGQSLARLVRREMFFEAFQTAANDVEKMKWDGKNRQETISGYF